MGSISQHHCAECNRTPDETKFRMNGSDRLRKYCEECSRKRHKRLRGDTPPTPAQTDDTPRVADGYAMMPYQGAVIAWDTDGGMVCLTDLHRAADSPENKDPYKWLRSEAAQEYIEACARRGLIRLGEPNSISRRGAHGGTWREKIIGLAYAQYLSADLYVACNQFILEKWGQARQNGVADELLRAIAERLGVLPRIEGKIDGLDKRLDSIDTISTSEPEQWVGQDYIIHITNEHQVFLLKRLFKAWPEDKLHLLAVGRAGPSGSIHEIRLKDYTGKSPFLPEDYSILSFFGTPTPDDCETHTLQYPLPGCERLRLKNGKWSLTFLAANDQGIQEYQRLGCGKYYTLKSLECVIPKPVPPPSPQTNFRELLGL